MVFKFKITELQHFLDFRFWILLQAFIIDFMNQTGQQAHPVRHQAAILIVKNAEATQIKTVILALGKVFKETTQTGVHGIASDVQNFRIRQDLPDDTQKLEVERMLINDPRILAIPTMRSQTRQVGFSHETKARWFYISQPVWKRQLIWTLPSRRVNDPAKRMELSCAKYAAVTG